MHVTGQGRLFLFLQGPHGPFFHALGRMLAAAGAQVRRVGFNRGDRVFWPDAASFIAHRGPAEDWPAHLDRLIRDLRVTDLVLYGDTRPVHAAAVAAARAAGLTLHVFEEGYLRPYWVTYERSGANGHSRLMRLDLAEMAAALSRSHADQPAAPTDWGDMRQHMFWGAIYHAFVFAGARAWPGFRAHRAIGLGTEARLHLLRLALQPWQLWQRARATRAILRSGHPFHLVLLQLEHDASFRSHSPFRSMAEFLGLVLEAFAQGAPPHHHLVLKAHPLEDGRAPLRAEVARLVARHGLEGRVHFVPGGRLSQLLDHARSAVTVNSTAGQQALWRGLPLRCCGAAVYARPGLVSTQPLAAFFARPQRPDCRAYRLFRRYLLETSQVVGGFYSRRGRRLLLRRVVDMMLSPDDPYDSLRRTTAEAGWCAGPDLPQGGAQHPQGPLARARQAATIPRM